MENESPGSRLWSGGLRLSMLGFYVIAVLLVLLFFVVGRVWWMHGNRLHRLDERIQTLQQDVELLEERGEWTLNYYRIQRGLDVLALRRIPPRQRQLLAEQLWVLSRDYNFDPLLVLAMVAHESKGNPWARGQFRSGAESGALGLMQIKGETGVEMAESFGITVQSEADLLKPEVNMVVGTVYLMKLMARYGNVSHAIMAYNIGPGAMDSRLRSQSRLPMGYYDDVMRSYHKLLVQLDQR